MSIKASCGTRGKRTTGNPFACELSIVMSPSFGEGLFLGMYCLACIRHAGSSGELLMKPSRMCWQGTICPLMIKFVLLMLLLNQCVGRSADKDAIEGVKGVKERIIYRRFYDVAWKRVGMTFTVRWLEYVLYPRIVFSSLCLLSSLKFILESRLFLPEHFALYA